MPNYIKNRITLSGDKKQIKQLFNKFNTHFNKELSRAHDERIICRTNGENYKIGWYDEITNKFEERGEKIVMGIPDEFEMSYNEAWDRFPDFNKIITMPESLNITSGSQGDTGLNILNGVSENQFMSNSAIFRRFYDQDISSRIEIMEMGIKYAKNIKEHGFKSWYNWSIEHWGTKWNASSCEQESKNVWTFETAWSGVPNLIEKISESFPKVKIVYEYSDEDTGSNCGIGYHFNGVHELKLLESQSKEAYELAFKLRPSHKEGYKLIGETYEYIDEE